MTDEQPAGVEWTDQIPPNSGPLSARPSLRDGSALSAPDSISAEVEQLRLDVAALREGKTPSAVRPVASLHPGASPVVVETTDDAYPAHWNPRRA